MLKTFLLVRPQAAFDANNVEHRRAYYKFTQKNSWNDCPYQFVVDAPYTDLLSCIRHKMTDYYIRQEFRRR